MIEYGGLFFMRRYYIEQKLKSAAAFLIILILLPYIVSVFVSGTGVRADRKEEETYVQVKQKTPGERYRQKNLAGQNILWEFWRKICPGIQNMRQ